MNLRSASIQELTTSPVGINRSGVVEVGGVGKAGQAMGIMGLTYSRHEVSQYMLTWITNNNTIRAVELK